jgi:tetratricopeptide (TPR) repeat protein
MSTAFHPFKHLTPFVLSLLLSLSPGLSPFMLPSAGAEEMAAADGNAVLAQHLEAARGYMQTSQWSFANYEWRAVLTQSPQNVEANVGLAEALLKSGFPGDAVRHLEETRRFVSKLSIELAYGKALETVGNVMGAKAVYQRNLERVPLESESFGRLVALLPLLPDTEREALRDDLAQKSAEALRQGRDALKKRNYNLAAAGYKIGTALKPTIGDVNDYGLALLLMGQYEEARHQFERVQRNQANRWEVYANAAFAALGRGNPHEAAVNLEKALGLCRDDSKKSLLYNDLGFIYENQSKWQKARNAYEKAIEMNPGFTKSKLNLAYAYQKDMAYPEAIRVYQGILASDPGNTKVLNRLGFVYELANKNRQALQAYQKAIAANPREQDGYYNLAILYKKLGKTKQADLAYKRLMEIEFTKMETAKDGAKERKTGTPAVVEAAAGQESRSTDGRQLLDYVDVFFLSSAAPSS